MDFQISRLEKTLALFAPSLAMRRARARMAFDMMARAYDGAATDRKSGGWTTTGASANTENLAANDKLRFRARDLERNNPVVLSAIQQFAGQAVGSGIQPRPQHDDKKLCQIAMDAWNRFAESCDPEGQHDYYGLQHLAARGMFRDGEILRIWLDANGVANSQIKLLESDHLDASRLASPKESTIISQGIEFDEWGRRLRYWLFPRHPGENLAFVAQGLSRAVDASQIDHFMHATRPGQARGVSWLAPAIAGFRALDDIDAAVMFRKKLEACIGLIMESPEISGQTPMLGEQKKDDKSTRTNESVRPGMIMRTGPGEKVLPFQPSVSVDNIEFARQKLYHLTAAIGMTYHSTTGDVSQANYSSLRAATVASWTMLDVAQYHALIPRDKAAWRRVMDREAMITGNKRLRDVRSQWSPPARPWVDPLKDISAKILEIRSGLQSMPDALGERGQEWLRQIDEIAEFSQACDDKNVVLDTDARRVNGSGSAQQTAAQPDPQPAQAA